MVKYMKIRITAIILAMFILSAEFFGGISAFALTESQTFTSDFNKEGIWLTEIYQNDIERNFENNTQELMEFVEFTSTFENPVKFNEMFQLYVGDIPLNINGGDGNGDIVIEKGQSVVVWNYRSDLLPELPTETDCTDKETTPEEYSTYATEIVKTTTTEVAIPTEEQFREVLRIPETAVVLKAENGLDWQGNTFSIKSKIDGKIISAFTVEENVHNAEGCSVQLKIPDIGSEMVVYRQMTVPTAGYIYHLQLNGTIDPYVPENLEAEGVFLTEIYPDDINRSETFATEAEIMEWVEISNTTSAQVDFNSLYQLVYAQKEGNGKVLDILGDCVIPAEGTAVFWCRTSAEITLADFRNAVGIGEEIPVFIIDFPAGFDNNQGCFQIFKIEGNHLVSQYSYNSTVDVSEGFSANLQVSAEGPDMILQKANAVATPGAVKTAQCIYVADDGSSVNLIPEYEIPIMVLQGDELHGSYDISATKALPFTNITTYYRFDDSGEWLTCQNTNIRVSKVYQYSFPAELLFEQEYMEIYVKAENFYRNTYLGVYKINIIQRNKFEGIRTNITNGEEVGETVILTANDGGDNINTEVYLDDIKQSTLPMLEDGGFLFFATDGTDTGYKNALTDSEDELITSMAKWKTAIGNSQVTHIDNKYFKYNSESKSYEVTLRFRSGTLGTVFDDYLVTDAVRDAFTVTNIALKTVNGITCYPDYVSTAQGENLSTDYGSVYQLGTDNPYIEAKFSIPSGEVTAVGTVVDTTLLSEGEHSFVATNGTDYTQVTFIVDNKAPVIKPKIEKDSILTGSIKIAPKIKDVNTLKEVAVYLDGELLETPYYTNAYELGKGQHTLGIFALDMAGNNSEKIVTFSVNYADLSVKKATASKISHNQATLKVKLKSGANAQVVFYQAKEIVGESITAETVQGILPYVQYTIETGTVSNTDEIIVNWKGSASNTDETHSVSMYVFNTAKNKWEKIATADENGNIKKASFVAKNHTLNGKAIVAVQCTTDTALIDTDTFSDGNKADENWDGTTAPENYDFAFAWETDTQFYSKKYPAHYKQMNRWIVNNAEEKKIKYVIHTGDLVADYDLKYQWETADQAMKILENGNVPYGVLAGNHDVASAVEDNSMYWKYFGEYRFATQPYYGGSYENNLGHYDLISENGQDFIILYMSWNIYQDEIDWMNDVLAKYSDRKAILCLHSYMKSTGIVNSTLLSYFGKMVQREVVAKNPNIFAVLNGHSHGASYETVKFDDDGDGVKERTVYQICTNYQNDSLGGRQYFKMLYFDLDNNRVYMNSYSPLLDDYNYFEDGNAEFMNEDGKIVTETESGIMEVEFDTTLQSIAAESFSAYIRGDKESGVVNANEKGEAILKLTGLTENTTYSWYAEVTAVDSTKIQTDFYDFRTLKAPVLSLDNKSLKAGERYNITVKNTNGKAVKYNVSKADSEYISVSSEGAITALKKTVLPVTVNVKVGSTLLQFKVTVKTNPKLTDRTGKVVRSLTVAKGKTKTVFIKGKAAKIDNIYVDTEFVRIKGKVNNNRFKIKGKKRGKTKVRVKVNGSKILKLKVKVK